ncbi:sensor domain-containing protein [Rhodococcus triatomae]|nr:sensor domain-containing protein [Rhodococcus triatomae]QNG25902.1 sensor domain-containing protein [Rhodococcus triatomae]
MAGLSLALVSVVAAVGCGQTIVGTATASEEMVDGARGGDLSGLLLDPAAFPPQYPAIVLPPSAVAQAAPDLTGVPPGAVVDPLECMPDVQGYGPDRTVMAVGTDETSRSTITVEVARVRESLPEWTERHRECEDITVSSSGATSEVQTRSTPARPVSAEDSAALRRTVTSGGESTPVRQSMLTLVAQTEDIRVLATLMYFGDRQPDTAALDDVFVEAIGAAGL